MDNLTSLINKLDSKEVHTNILNLVDAIRSNKKFSKLIIYSLNTLKSYLIQSGSESLDNSIFLIKCDLLKIFSSLYQFHLSTEEVLIKIGEILFYIISNLSTNSSNYNLFKLAEGDVLVKEILMQLSPEFIEANKIYLKNLQSIIEISQNLNSFDSEIYFSIIVSLIKKLSSDSDLMVYLFETLKKISNTKKVKDFISNEFLDILIETLSTTQSHKIATLGLQILDSTVKTSDIRDLVRSNKPITFVTKLLSKFKEDNLLSFHACGLLSKILEKEDVYAFLKLLKIKSTKDILSEGEFESGLSEIKELVENQDDSSFFFLKKNITRVLILMSKDKNFINLLSEMNSLDIFVAILKSDLESLSHSKEESNDWMMQHILPNLIRLILSLLKHSNFSYNIDMTNLNYSMRGSIINQEHQRTSLRYSLNSNLNGVTHIFNKEESNVFPSNSNYLMKDIYFCLFKSLNFFYNDRNIVFDILDFINNKDRKLLEDILDEFDFEQIFALFSKLLKTYYNNKNIYSFFGKIVNLNFDFEYSNNTGSTGSSKSNFNFVSILKNASLYLELILNDGKNKINSTNENKKENSNVNLNSSPMKQNYHRVLNINSKNELVSKIMDISLYLILSNSSTYNFNDNSFGEFYSFSISLLNLFENLENESLMDLVNPFITMIFSAIENKHFGLTNLEEKTKLVLLFLGKISKKISQDNNSSFSLLYKYLLLRLNRISEIKTDNNLSSNTNTMSKPNLNILLFNNEVICEFVLTILEMIISNTSLDENMSSDCLNLVYYIQNNCDTFQISRFLELNGLIKILKISLMGVYDYEINKTIISIIKSFSQKHSKESVLIYKNFFSFKTFIIQLKDIKFSKGVNEKIYWEILSYSKTLFNSCDFSEAVEETNFIEHLTNEYNEIYCFYLDTDNRILEIISEMFSIMSKKRNLLKSLLNTKLLSVFNCVLKYISESSQGNDKIVFHLCEIFISFFKSKDYSKLIYNNHKSILEMIKNILFKSKFSEESLNKVLQLCQLLVDYENAECIKDKIVTQVFFRELAMNIPAGQKKQKELIEKFIVAIENPFSDKMRKSINESNSKLIKELSELVKADRKNAVIKRDNTITSRMSHIAIGEEYDNSENNDNFFSPGEQGDVDYINDPNMRIFQKRRSLINIKENAQLKIHFENIINNINLITESIVDNCEDFNSEQESEQLSDLLKMLCLFAKNEENLKKIYECGLFDKLIIIMEDNTRILAFAKDQAFNLLEKLIEDDEVTSRLFENGRVCDFFIKEINKIGKFYFPDHSEFIRNKVYAITKIIAKLSEEKVFAMHNNESLNAVNIFNMMSTIQCDKEIILNLLIIFNNLICNTNALSQIRELKIANVLYNIWRKHKDEIRVVEKVMKIVENLYLEETIIRDLLDFDLVESINEVLKSPHSDSEGILNLLNLIDILMFHRYFAAKIIEQKTLTNLISAITINMFNTKIVEKSGSVFLKGAKLDKNFLTILGVYGIKEFCLQILSKYMTTCYSNIIKQTLELIYILISDENNLNFFGRGESMEIILKTFKISLKNKDHVVTSLKLINVITTKDVEVKLERARKNSVSNDTVIKLTFEDTSSSISYDFTILIEIINEILSEWSDYIDIIMGLCELINNIFKISNEVWLKKFMIDVIVNNADKYLNKQDYVQLFLNTMYFMIKADSVILDLDCSSVLHYISKIMDVKLNYNIILTILKMLKQVSRSKNINVPSNLTEIVKILKCVENNVSLLNDDLIILFSQILGYLCVNTSYYKEVSSEFVLFILKYLTDKPPNSTVHAKLLEDLKNISVYIHIKNEEICGHIADLLKLSFHLNLTEMINKNLMNIFQIVSSFCVQSDFIKIALNNIGFNDVLKDTLSKSTLEDTLLQYQAKGCLLNLKLKNVNNTSRVTNASTLRSMSINLSQVEVKEEAVLYLRTEKIVKVYTDKGENKEKTLQMNDTLSKIVAFTRKKNTIEVFAEMEVKEMDSCVRSCGTAAFSKSRGLFSKKPKPARCFSILGFKTMKGQKTFNVECDKEEDCIKYVDYISIIIQNYKSMKEEHLSNITESVTSSLNNPFENFK